LINYQRKIEEVKMTFTELFNSNFYNTDKDKHNYLQAYDKLFYEYRDKKINLLEVGVHEGGSLLLWKDYFSNGTIYGMDNNPEITLVKDIYRYRLNRNIFRSDSRRKKEVDKQLRDLKFDIIIDDGDHRFGAQLKTYMNLKHRLKENGIYIIEDVKPTLKSFRKFEYFKFNNIDCRIYKNKIIQNTEDSNLMVWRYKK
jgi:hypothetical protein|tara:strand:+ start:24 stop:617 length:594 start_codon:yes stop_codon:yes gene_type:complete